MSIMYARRERIGYRAAVMAVLAWAYLSSCSDDNADPGDGIGDGGSPQDAGTGGATNGGGDSSSGGTPAIDVGGATGGTGAACSESCGPREACLDGRCVDACAAAQGHRASVGCEYYAVFMDLLPTNPSRCFAAILSNASEVAAHVEVDFGGEPVDLAQFARTPVGAGRALSYEPFDPQAGIAPRSVAIVFLADVADPEAATYACPAPAARGPEAFFNGTGRGRAFRIRTDVPIVAYQMLPFGGGAAGVAGSSLLIPASAWDINYVAVNAYEFSNANANAYDPSLSIVAASDGTDVTIRPKVAIAGGDGVASTAAGTPVTYRLDAGEVLQISQPQELTGSPIQATAPIGVFAGHQCMRVPSDVSQCDHGEQQVPPVRALGYEYAAARHRDRGSQPERSLWRIVGAVDGTQLTTDPPLATVPERIGLGDVVEFETDDPFLVRSQDEAHPFLLFSYMSGGQRAGDGMGDPEFMRMIAPAQYLRDYVFFTDPTYPETNLVVIRQKRDGQFAPVSLDCAGELSGWAPIGTAGSYEYTRIDLVRHVWEPQGNCDNGWHNMRSDVPFGLYVWGWGSNETIGFPQASLHDISSFVSYGYPAGENLAMINEVIIPADIE